MQLMQYSDISTGLCRSRKDSSAELILANSLRTTERKQYTTMLNLLETL